ncbi:MAG: hypothetical protein FJ358_07225 [Thaumarchaeota archaeon]|nr:hypothetical protein [Nitrososphaerota archaeon]
MKGLGKDGTNIEKVCPTCGVRGMGAYLKAIPRKSKSGLRVHHYYYFAHYVKGNKLDWCYVGKTLPNQTDGNSPIATTGYDD